MGANANASYGEGRTALIDAAWLGHVDVVILLLQRGAVGDAMTTNGHTALIIARLQRSEELCRLLEVSPGGE